MQSYWKKLQLILISIIFLNSPALISANDKNDAVNKLAQYEILDSTAGLKNHNCAIEIVSKIMTKRLLDLLNQTRNKKKLVELTPNEVLQCKAQGLATYLINKIHNEEVSDKNKIFMLADNETQVADAGEFKDMLPHQLIKKINKRINFPGYNNQYSRIGIGYATDLTLPKKPGFTGWILLFKS